MKFKFNWTLGALVVLYFFAVPAARAENPCRDSLDFRGTRRSYFEVSVSLPGGTEGVVRMANINTFLRGEGVYVESRAAWARVRNDAIGGHPFSGKMILRITTWQQYDGMMRLFGGDPEPPLLIRSDEQHGVSPLAQELEGYVQEGRLTPEARNLLLDYAEQDAPFKHVILSSTGRQGEQMKFEHPLEVPFVVERLRGNLSKNWELAPLVKVR